ncbi:MAG: signal peptidase II, partial [Anaerolineales bacterium]
MALGGERRLFWFTAAGWVVADLITKLVAEAHLSQRFAVEVLGDVVQLRLVYNPCAAFGICLGDSSRWVFFGLAILVLVFLGDLVRKTPPADRFRLLSLALV